MKYKLLLITLLVCGIGWGQVTATSSTSLTTTSSVSEQFTNTSGANAYTTGFPSSWSLSSATNQTTAPSSTSTSGGWYAGNDIGFLGSGSASNGNATWRLQNNTNSQITGFSLSFKAKMYKSGSNSPSVQVFYSINSTGTIPSQGPTGFTAISSLTVGDASTFSNTVNTSGVTLSTSPSNNITGLTLANTNYLYIRFIFSGGSSSDLFSIDDVTITPILAATSYTVTFDKNAVDASGSMTNQTASVASSLSSNLFTRSGYYFSGWNTAANGSGTSYTDGATYSFTSDVTLYAQWQTPTWNGTIWSNSIVPTSSLNAIINGDLTTTTDLVCKDLTINSGKTLTIGAGKKLTVSGNLINNGTIVFKSDTNGTAMFDVFNGTQSGTGVVTVERYIPSGKRAFRLLSPAVTTTTFISGNWQQQTHITGGASGGFDVTETNNPSMYTYNNQAATGSGWTPIANTTGTNLTTGVGYRVLVRGDRTAANITAASADNMNAAITLSATGTLKTGTVTLNSSSTPAINNTSNTTTADYSLVGNPYQSAVDWHLVTRSGIEDTYYAWAPNMGSGAARGNYVAYNVSSGNSGGGSVGQFIQPGQAFFVKNITSGTAGTLTFDESDKATTSANVFRSANTPTLGVALYDPNELAIGAYPIDATKAVFSTDYSNELGLGDAAKLEAAGENIAWFRNNTKLAIDAAAPVTTSDELAMKTMRLGANKNYTFKIETTNFDSDLTPYLVDNFLNTQTEITTSQAFLASFVTTSNQASYSEDRFKIVFQTSALSTDDFANNIKLYPNPAKAGGSFYVDGITEATVSVYNVVGQNIPVTVMSQGNAIEVIPSASLSKGVYLVSITTQGITKQVKWIVE